LAIMSAFSPVEPIPGVGTVVKRKPAIVWFIAVSLYMKE